MRPAKILLVANHIKDNQLIPELDDFAGRGLVRYSEIKSSDMILHFNACETWKGSYKILKSRFGSPSSTKAYDQNSIDKLFSGIIEKYIQIDFTIVNASKCERLYLGFETGKWDLVSVKPFFHIKRENQTLIPCGVVEVKAEM